MARVRPASRSVRAALASASACAALTGCGGEEPLRPQGDAPAAEWPSYGGDPGGRRYTPLAEITPANVDRLRPAWTYHTGALPDARGEHGSTLASEVTPLLVDGTLYLCTPYNRVVALDPETGRERWSHDPQIDLSTVYSNQLVCRGVSTWFDPQRAAGAACRRRIFTNTNDARLLALDAASGEPCADFGSGGSVDLRRGVGRLAWPGEYHLTSPPAVAGDLVVTGSAIGDNQRRDAPSGVIRAFDARSGELRWAWDLRPPGFVPTPQNTSEAGYALGTPNVWAPMAVDEARDLLFVATGNPSPDYFRGDSELDHFGSSVVALRASSGERVWHFQTVHRDLWDFDVPAQPTLFTLRRQGRETPALVQATKMGLLFVLHRETGEPLFGVDERPVPRDPAPHERVAPTQPFPRAPPPLVRLGLDPAEAWGLTVWDRARCRETLAGLRNEGIYTPPSLEGSLMLPGNAGGANWGGVAVDEAHQRLVVNVQDFPWAVRLHRRGAVPEELRGEVAPMRGTPYAMHRELVLSPLGIPCSPPPWGELVGVDLAEGDILWRSPLGTLRDVAPIPLPMTLGIPNLGGPLISAGGLVFIGAALDHYLRAFDLGSGEELWRARLPAGGQATPMSYRVRPGGRQFVLIAATGYGRAGKVGDAIVAFALE